MNILFITIDVPMPSFASSARSYYGLKYLSEKYGHEITLLSFRNLKESSKYLDDVNDFCKKVVLVDIPNIAPFSFSGLVRMGKNVINPHNIFSGQPDIINVCYSNEMANLTKELVAEINADLIYVNWYSLIYCVNNLKIPAILEVQESASDMYGQLIQHDVKMINKIKHYLQYFQAKLWEKRYKNFNICISPAQQDVDSMISRMPDTEFLMIPPGVDTEYFQPMKVEPYFPSIIFLGGMGVAHNIHTVLYFYREIYPLIKQKLPSIKFLIVGRDPSEEILKLAEDDSVTVTGYVDDVRPYLARATVLIAPHIGGMGIKTKLQEAMAMARPIVSTSIGVAGFNVNLDNAIDIADDPQNFADKVIELISDTKRQEEIGIRARSIVQENYSWEAASDRLNEVFHRIVNG